MRKRVVVTGLGWVTPMGHDIPTVWRRLLAADSGMVSTTLFDARTFPTTFAAEVKDYDFPAADARLLDKLQCDKTIWEQA